MASITDVRKNWNACAASTLESPTRWPREAYSYPSERASASKPSPSVVKWPIRPCPRDRPLNRYCSRASSPIFRYHFSASRLLSLICTRVFRNTLAYTEVASGVKCSYLVCMRISTSERRKRRCPPWVRCEGRYPWSAQDRTVLGWTPKYFAAWLKLSHSSIKKPHDNLDFDKIYLLYQFLIKPTM